VEMVKLLLPGSARAHFLWPGFLAMFDLAGQWRRHGVDWDGHVNPTSARGRCGVPGAAWPIMTVCPNSSGVSSSLVGSDRTTRRSGIYMFMYSMHQQLHASSSYHSSS